MPNFNGLWTSRQQMQARGGNTWPALPGAPTSPVATAGNMSASVAFTAPANIGYPGSITGYRVTSSPGGFTGTGLTSPVTVTGLTNGTAYTFTVAAQNVNGYGPESVASNSVTPILPNYVEDVFSTWLYTGNGSTQTINNGIDLAGKGGLVWTKHRGGTGSHALVDTVRGGSSYLRTNLTNAADTSTAFLSFNNNGYNILTGQSDWNFTTNPTYASWTFREQPKFFDVVTWTGTGLSRTVSHNLGCVPACIIVKRTDAAADWQVYNALLDAGGSAALSRIVLNSTAGQQSASLGYWDGTAPTSTVFSLGGNTEVNASGGTYVAYLFANEEGGFGLTGTDNVITCGSYSGTGAAGNVVNLGYEPQWVLVKIISGGTSNWQLMDTMRGMPVGGVDARLFPNSGGAEDSSFDYISPTATGFQLTSGATAVNASGATYIYIAVRRGPMAVPTTGTSVFMPYQVPASPTTGAITGFVTDAGFIRQRSVVEGASWGARLMGNPTINSTNTNAESANTNQIWDRMNGWWNTAINNYMTWGFARAPGFMDVVCYTGNGPGTQTLSHNLSAQPELIIVKGRNEVSDWWVYSLSFGQGRGYLQLTNAFAATTEPFTATPPTSSVFYVGGGSGSPNSPGRNHVAYLFASCPGVSKVGSYTGTGATQIIACGFAAGARFVLIKATSTTGGWLYWDSVRGIVAGNDPYLALNSTAVEVTGTDWVDTATTGFELSNAGGNLANSNGVSYIFLAIA